MQEVALKEKLTISKKTLEVGSPLVETMVSVYTTSCMHTRLNPENHSLSPCT